MALRLSKALSSTPAKSNGFDIKFTEGITYNLDELVANKNRTDADAGLVIEVKKSKEIAELALNKLKSDISYQLDISFKSDEIQKNIESIVTGVFSRYECDNTNMTELAHKALNFEINDYLRNVYDKYNITYTIHFSDMNKVTITADFVGNDDLTKAFSEYYEQYRKLYNDNMKVSEGGLAISDEKRGIRIDKSDYAKYLLDEKSETTKTSNTTPSYTRAPVVVWEDGTEDTRTENPVETVYDHIQNLQSRVVALENVISEKM